MAANWKFELMLLELRAATVDPIQKIKFSQADLQRVRLMALISGPCKSFHFV